MPSSDDITAVAGNANDMTLFEDETFDLVMSNATLEHDKHFWLSLAEVRRVLAPGGLLVIGASGFTKNPERDHGKSTHTYRCITASTTTASANRHSVRCSSKA